MRTAATTTALVLAGCAPSVLNDARWEHAAARPGAAACTVTVEDVGPIPWTGTRIYTADGRLVWGQNRLEYDSLSEDRVEHDAAGRVARVTTRYQRQFREGNCDVEGGCDEPAERRLTQTRFLYDGEGRIAGGSATTVSYEMDRKTDRWTEVDTDEYEQTFRYDDAGRIAERRATGGSQRFGYVDGRVATAAFRSDMDTRMTVERDAAGRFARVDQGYAVRTFEYDADGRVARVVTDGDNQEQEERWHYDAAGRLVSFDRGYLGVQDAARATIEYAYDDGGHLISRGQNGQVIVHYRYAGACDDVVVEPSSGPPAPFELAFGGTCVGSAGNLVNVCAPLPP